MATKRELAKEKTMSAITQAAAAEFAELGYNDSTIRSIAARAGVASGLVCTYFESKEKLLCLRRQALLLKLRKTAKPLSGLYLIKVSGIMTLSSWTSRCLL